MGAYVRMARRSPAALVARGPLLLGLLVGLAALLRLLNLADNPGWDGDEGYNWSIATSLAVGHVQRFALQYTFVDHPPLFYLLGAGIMRVWTHDLIALRTLSTLCGVATVPALYALAGRLGSRREGLMAACIYAIWPLAVLQSRWCYTYNLLSLLLVLALWAALPPYPAPENNAGSREMVLPTGHATHDAAVAGDASLGTARPRSGLAAALTAGLLAGLALATDQEGASVAIAVCATLWWRGGLRLALPGALAAAGPPALYIGWMLAIRRSAFLFDLRHTAGRVGGGGVLAQIGDLLVRALHLLEFDPLIALGALGLLALPRSPQRRILWLQAALLALIALKVRDPSPNVRAAIPLLPLCALGLGALIGRVLAWRSGRGSSRRGISTVRLLLALLGLLMAGLSLAGAAGRFPTAIGFSLPRSTVQAYRLADWINARTGSTDLVIAMPQIAPLLGAHTAELLEAVARDGQGTEFYPAGINPARFAYDTRLAAARYLVLDDFTRLWIKGHPGERALVAQAARSWRVVYRRGEYMVLAPPRH